MAVLVLLIPVAHERMNVCSFVDRERWDVSSLRGVYVVLADMMCDYATRSSLVIVMVDGW